MEIWDFVIELSLKNHWNISRSVWGNLVPVMATRVTLRGWVLQIMKEVLERCCNGTETVEFWLNVLSLNSLAPRRSWCYFKNAIFNFVLLIGILRSPYNNALWRMPPNITDGKSTLVQVMTWCCQATSHYLSQCWPRSLSPYGITKPQWVNSLKLNDTCMRL